MGGAVAFFALMLLGAWFLGPAALRVGGALLIVKGLLTPGDYWVWILLGLLVAGASEGVDAWLVEVKRHLREAALAVPLARQVSEFLDQVKRRVQPPASRIRRAGGAGARCPSGKDVFATRAGAQRSVERSQGRHAAGQIRTTFETPLDHAYQCPHCGQWHVSSKPGW